MAFEEEFGCEIPDDAAEKIVTLKDAVTYLSANSNQKNLSLKLRRVVVTGLGTINPLGNNVKDSWDSLINSKSGLKNITAFDVNEYPCQIAGSIDPELISEDIVSPREQRKIDRFITLGLIAAHEAFLDSGFEVNEESSFRSGVMVGSVIQPLPLI